VSSTIRRAVYWLIAALAVCTGTSCGRDNKPVSVTGRVTVDGLPVANAGVVFHPKDGNGRPARAETAEDGTFKLTTYTEGDGALKGDYRVTIVWDEPVHPYMQYRDGAPKKEALLKEYLEWKASHKERPSPIPPEYANPGTTPLEHKVTSSGVANFDIKTSK
jgi:hypothetical protein